MTENDDGRVPDNAIYWEELAQRIQGAVLREVALSEVAPSMGHNPQRVNDETGWLAARFPLASYVALAAAAAALFVVGWMRPMPRQRDVESAWTAAFSPRSFDLTVGPGGAPSLAALVLDGETLGPLPERASTGTTQ
ncbi:MAG: hypothetical protein ABI035_00245 [Gemmatimonadaceae bacterium]